jgi:polysaccharide deacetylase 2 family uncharacterized protein YibQ
LSSETENPSTKSSGIGTGRLLLRSAWALLFLVLALAAGFVYTRPMPVDIAANGSSDNGAPTQDPAVQDPAAQDPGADNGDGTQQAGLPDQPDKGATSGSADIDPYTALQAAIPESAPWRSLAAGGDPLATAENSSQIAVVITGLGLSTRLTRAAIETLPAGVTLSFSPYSRNLDAWITQARAEGHEVLLDLPLEAVTYPDDDPGPHTLETGLSKQDNLDRLGWVLSRSDKIVGLAAHHGSRFMASEEDFAPLVAALAEGGHLFVANGQGDVEMIAQQAKSRRLPWALVRVRLDQPRADPAQLKIRLKRLETLAKDGGSALGMARASAGLYDVLGTWARQLDASGLTLVPVSSLSARTLARNFAQANQGLAESGQ